MTPALVKQEAGKWALRAAGAVLVLYVLAVVALMMRQTDVFQINFKLYYVAGQALSQGLNAYDDAVLTKLAGEMPLSLPYLYPPLTLWLFVPLSKLDYATAHAVFLGAKLAMMVGLWWLWRRAFLGAGAGQGQGSGLGLGLGVLCLIGFNYAAYHNFNSGNIALLIDVLIWLGLWCFARGRLGMFTGLIVLAACFKFTPLFFLSLLLLTPGRAKWVWGTVGAGGMAVYLGVNRLLYPTMFADYLQNLTALKGATGATGTAAADGRAAAIGDLSATLPLIKHVLSELGQKASVAVPGAASAVVFLMFAAVVMGVTALTLWRDRATEPRVRGVEQSVLAVLAYMLVMPRFKLYEFVIGLLPAFYLAARLPRVGTALLLIVVMIPAPLAFSPPGLNMLVDIGSQFYPIVSVAIVWMLLIAWKWGLLGETDSEAATRTSGGAGSGQEKTAAASTA